MLNWLGGLFRKPPIARTPTVLQMEAVECGAAALASVLGYYGRYIPLEELRVACGVSRDGTKASNILKAAREYGLLAKGFSREVDGFHGLKLPLIVFWSFNHFVVVEGFRGKKVYLNDPAMGPRVISLAEFEAAFTGVVLVFEPGPQFQPGGQKPRMGTALRSRVRGSESGILFVFLASLALALVGLALPILTKIFVDFVLIREFTSWLPPLLIGLLITALLRLGLTWLQQSVLLKMSMKIAVTSSYEFLRHLLRLPVEYFTQRYGGEVGGRIEINDRLAGILSGGVSSSLLNMLMTVCYVAVMLSLDVLLTSIVLIFAGLNFAVLKFVSRRRKDVNVHLLQERGKLLGVAMSGLQGIENLKATGRENDFFSRWAGLFAKTVNAGQKLQVFSLALESVPSFLTSLAAVVILSVGALRVLDGDMSIGTVVAFQGLMLGFFEPINQLLSLGGTLQELEGELGRLDDVLRYPIESEIANERSLDLSPETRPKLDGRIELQNITYGYSRLDPPLITGLNLSARPGSRVALVGASASGKSTVAKLICGLYRPWTGKILLDGVPREELPRSLVTNSLAMVDQDFFLYEGTVRDVLTLWDKTVPEADIIQAAKDACIHDEIAARPGGYDSLVEEGGRNFSNGQQQRLEIARALVTNPSILVLDEATSALDPVTEKQIDENLRRRGCTCIIVAHRLSTIRDCDEIIVLDRGRQVQRGTHDKLHTAPGLYQKLINA